MIQRQTVPENMWIQKFAIHTTYEFIPCTYCMVFLVPRSIWCEGLVFIPSVDHLGNDTKRFATHLKKQGKVQDIYYNYALPGDHYVGCILAGLDCN